MEGEEVNDTKPIYASSPNAVWYPSRIVDGVQLWASRNWKPGERAAYCREALNREPSQAKK